MKRNGQSGFSLVELLVVIAIMLVLVASFAPAVVASIQAGNEQATVNNLKQMVNAQVAYSRLYPSKGYSATATLLGNGNSTGCPAIPDALGNGACLIPDAAAKQLDAGVLNNYQYAFASDGAAPSTSWILTAWPATSYGGRKEYCVDSSGVIYYKLGTSQPSGNATTGCPSGSGGMTPIGQ